MSKVDLVERTAFPELQKREDETDEQHRALVLYAMCDPDGGVHRGASMTAIATLMGKGRRTVYKWRDKFDWTRRLGTHSEGLQAEAASLYRHRYHKRHGVREVVEIEHRMRVVYPANERGYQSYTNLDVQSLDERLERKRAEEIEKVLKHRDNLLKVANGLIADVAAGLSQNAQRRKEALRTGKAYKPFMKVNASDLSAAVKLMAYLEATKPPPALSMAQPEEGGESPQTVLVEMKSERVRQAEARGEGVLEAMLEDAQELAVMIEVMIDHRDRGAAGLQGAEE